MGAWSPKAQPVSPSAVSEVGKMKISATQQEILDLMANGWELSQSTGIDSWWTIQKGGTGRGGETRTVSSATAYVLLDKGFIKMKSDGFPKRKYCLI